MEKNPLADLKNLVQGNEPEDTEEEIEIDEEQMSLLMDNISLMADGDLFIMQAIILNANAIVCENIRERFYADDNNGEGSADTEEA